MRANIFTASTEHGNLDVFQMPYNFFKVWIEALASCVSKTETLTSIGRARCADVLEIVAPNLCGTYLDYHMEPLVKAVIPGKPDTPADIQALECLERIRPQISKALNDRLLLKVAGSCCSIEIAEFFLAGGASVSLNIGGSRPILAAAKQTSLEAARFMEFLVTKGAITADSAVRFKGKVLSKLPGPRNIHNWIGITWEELVKESDPSA